MEKSPHGRGVGSQGSEDRPHGSENRRTDGKMAARNEFLLHEPVSRNPVLTFGEIRCFIPAMAELDQLLQATSRSFYLTLGVLPALVAKR
jgi:hypothetical protein